MQLVEEVGEKVSIFLHTITVFLPFTLPVSIFLHMTFKILIFPVVSIFLHTTFKILIFTFPVVSIFLHTTFKILIFTFPVVSIFLFFTFPIVSIFFPVTITVKNLCCYFVSFNCLFSWVVLLHIVGLMKGLIIRVRSEGMSV